MVMSQYFLILECEILKIIDIQLYLYWTEDWCSLPKLQLGSQINLVLETKFIFCTFKKHQRC